MIAALFVMLGGPYFGLDDVDPWDAARDARRYPGPHPVVAHPPCKRWGKFAEGSPRQVARGHRLPIGDDGGCFAAALAACQQWGGIIEHPEGSRAWPHFGLNTPPKAGGWVAADWHGGWTCRVEQGFYGHFGRKPTWLLAYHCETPSLRWGDGETVLDLELAEVWGLRAASRRGEVARVGGGWSDAQRNRTPAGFRDLLIDIARTARPPGRVHAVA